jgi:CPA2 family monovalent cation:H+ antiporter-2
VGLAAALAAAAAAHAIGFSREMGAFLAGFVLAGTPFRHQLSGQIGPLRDIFAAIFFTTVGMRVSPAVIAEGWWVIALGVVVMVALKALLIGGLCWTLGAMASTSVIVGLYLAQAGEFSLVLVRGAADVGLLTPGAADRAIALIVISLVITPALAEGGRRLARMSWGAAHAPWVRSAFDEQGAGPEAAGSEPRHVVIGGYGPVGRRVAEELDRLSVPYTVIELNPDTVREQLRRRRPIVFGDVANLRVLESAGIGRADVLVLTVPDEDAVLQACAVARRRAPSIFIAARTDLASRSRAVARIGADVVVVDEMSCADAMARVVASRLAAPSVTPAAAPVPLEAAVTK